MSNDHVMPVSRRRVLGATAAGLSLLAARPLLALAETAAAVRFDHGVASGDPLADRVILWTRITPIHGRPASVPVAWEAATSPEFAPGTVVASGRTATGPERDYTVKIDAGLPRPDTTYWYRFAGPGAISITGRTRTAPVGRPTGGSVRLAATTCNNPAVFYEDTYLHLARRDDLHAVIHTGDYIYDHGSGFWDSPTAITLDDYRRRHAFYRSRTPSIAVHAAHPWVILWDDGDIVGGASVHAAYTRDHLSPEEYDANVVAAVRAWDEWVPARLDVHSPLSASDKVAWEEALGRSLPPWFDRQLFRTLPWGDLVELVKLDTLIEGKHDNRGDTIVTYADRWQDSEDLRRISPHQLGWLAGTMHESAAQWKLVLSQTLFGHWAGPGLPDVLPDQVHDFFGIREHGNPFYSSSWNGYPAERRRVLRDCVEGVDDVVIVSGDAHLSIAQDVAMDPYDPVTYDRTGRGSLAVEVCTPSVNSEAFPEQFGYPYRTASLPIEAASLAGNPHQAYCEFDSKGYTLLDLDGDRCRAEYWLISPPGPPAQTVAPGYEPSPQVMAAALETHSGDSHLRPSLIG